MNPKRYKFMNDELLKALVVSYSMVQFCGVFAVFSKTLK